MGMQELANVCIGAIETRKPVYASTGDSLIDVAGRMRERGRGAVLVQAEDGKLAGIFTEQDLTAQIAANDEWRDVLVGDVMTPSPTCIRHDESLSRALELMGEGGFRNLPSVDDEGRPVSIVSIRDILAYVAAHYPEEFVNLPPDPSREARRPWGG